MKHRSARPRRALVARERAPYQLVARGFGVSPITVLGRPSPGRSRPPLECGERPQVSDEGDPDAPGESDPDVIADRLLLETDSPFGQPAARKRAQSEARASTEGTGYAG